MTLVERTRYRLLAYVAALLVGLLVVLAGGTHPASAAAGAETRVRASSEISQPAVGPPKDVSAGQHWGYEGRTPGFVVATGVAAKSVTSIGSDSVRFSQNKAGAGVAEIAESMRANGWVGDPIDVVKMGDGGLTSLDNRRLLAAKMAGIDVKASVHGFDDLIPADQAGRFVSRKGVVPTTWGEAITNRIGNQSAGYRKAWPSGSPWTGYGGN